MKKLAVANFRGLDGLSQMRPMWQSLLEQIDTPFFYQRIEWYSAYLSFLQKNDTDVHFFLVTEADQPIFILPLERKRFRIGKWPFQVWESPRHAHFPLNGIIAGDRLRSAHLIFLFDTMQATSRMRSDAIILGRFAMAPHDKIWREFQNLPQVICETMEPCSCIEIGGFDAWRQCLSKNFRNNLRKARNKLNKFDTRVETAIEGDMLELAFNEFVRIEGSGWKGMTGTRSAIGLDENVRQFYLSVARAFSRWSGVEINLLYAGQQAIAGQFVLRQGKHAFVLKIGYDEAHSKMAPGNLLFEDVIRQYSQKDSIRHVNLITDRQWHQNWHPVHLPTQTCYIFNASLKSRIAFILKKLHGWTQAIRSRMIQGR